MLWAIGIDNIALFETYKVVADRQTCKVMFFLQVSYICELISIPF